MRVHMHIDTRFLPRVNVGGHFAAAYAVEPRGVGISGGVKTLTAFTTPGLQIWRKVVGTNFIDEALRKLSQCAEFAAYVPSNYFMRQLLLGIVFLSLTYPQLSAAVLYVDYAAGSDANAGSSAWYPWKHCPGDSAASGVAAARTLAPGDVVLFRGGVTYVLTGPTGIALKSNGSTSAPIVYESGSKEGWGSGPARFTDNNGGSGITAFSSPAFARYLEFRSLEFYRIGGASALPADNGTPVTPRYGGGIAFANGVENVSVTDCTFRELGYWSNQKPMSASSLNGSGVSAAQASNLKITRSRFSRVAFGIDLAAASALSTVEISQCVFEEAVVWPLQLPVGPNAAAASSVTLIGSSIQPDITFASGAWNGYGSVPATDVATVAPGATATLYATAISSLAPTYQWRRNGSPIAGVTGAQLRLASVSASDAGVYTATASNSGGSATSNAAVLTVSALPAIDGSPLILTQPQSQVAAVGSTARFEVRASGSPAPTFQWQKNGAPLSGQTSDVLILNGVTVNDAVGYSVVVSNSVGKVVSRVATLEVSSGPIIAIAPLFQSQPQSQSVPLDSSASMSVVVSGQPTPAVQWKRNGVDIPGANSPTLYLSPVTNADFGFYQAIATNAAGTASSATAKLTRSTTEASITVPVFITQPENLTASSTATVSFTAAASAYPEPTYQWQKNGSSIPGATAGTLTIPSVTTNDRATYRVIATNAAGSATSNSVELTVVERPFFTVQPVSQTGNISTPLTLSVIAAGNPAPTYQWRKDGAAITGANLSTFTLPSLTPADAGSYSVVATNAAGEVTSNAALVTVTGLTVSTPDGSSTSTEVKTVMHSMLTLTGSPYVTSFTISGSVPRRMLVRAVGPSLAALGATDLLVNPVAELWQDERLILTNDNWKGTSVLSTALAQAGTFPFTSVWSADAAFVLTLDPGTYGLKVYGNPSSVGLTLIEVYELP